MPPPTARPAPPAVPVETLLVHREWVRALARSLVRDPGSADDVEQETWLRALRSPPRDGRSPRGWLAAVVRHLAVDLHRRRARAGRHERAAARGEALPSTASLVAAAESHERVVLAVLALEEPWRTTILLRFHEGLPPREIARRGGLPVETVRSRLKRAQARLADALGAKADPGDGRALAVALAPLLEGEGPPPAPAWVHATKGAVLMGTRAKAATVAAVVLVLGLGWWTLGGSGGGPRPAGEGAGPDGGPVTGASAPRDARDDGDGSAAGRRHGAPVPPASRAVLLTNAMPLTDGTAAAPAGAADAVVGRVTRADGTALAGVGLAIVPMDRPLAEGEVLPEPSRHVTTGEDGSFTVDRLGTARWVGVRAAAPGWRSAETWVVPGAGPVALVLERALPLRGVVVDGLSGEGIPGMVLLARREPAFAGGPASVATSGERGAFEFPDLDAATYAVEVRDPRLDPAPGNRLRAEFLRAAAGGAAPAPEPAGGGDPAVHYAPSRVAEVRPGGEPLRIPLERGLAIGGRVVDAAGAPVSRAFEVQVLGRTEHGNPDYGRFRAGRFSDAEGAFRIEGLAPGAYDLTVRAVAEGNDEASPLAAATAVSGVDAGRLDLRIEMATGEPLQGRLLDEAREAIAVEGYLYVHPAGSPVGGRETLALRVADGAFTTVPLDSGRTYDVLATGFPGYVQAHATGVRPGGPPVEIVLRRGGDLRGRVVDGDGKPVPAGVAVTAGAMGVDRRQPGTGMTAYTDGAGAFRIEGLADHAFEVIAGGGESDYASGPAVRGVRVGATDLVLRVRAGVVLCGRLVDGSGRPFRTHYLAGGAVPPDGAVSSWCRVEDAEGRFVLRGLPAGKVALSCYRGDAWVSLGEFTAPAEGLEVTVPDR